MEYEENASLEAKVVKDFDKVQFHISYHQVGGIMATSVWTYQMVVLVIIQQAMPYNWQGI